jgi:hypothetical protein
MRKLMIAAGAAAMLAASTISSYAAEATGTVQSIDPVAGTVTLADGSVFKLPAQFDAAMIQVGADVTIIYDEGADGAMEATAVTPNS